MQARADHRLKSAWGVYGNLGRTVGRARSDLAGRVGGAAAHGRGPSHERSKAKFVDGESSRCE